MRYFFKKTIVLSLAAALAAGLLAGCTNETAASSAPSETPTAAPSEAPVSTISKADIETKLEADKAYIQSAVWAPDDSAVVFTRKGTNGANVCIWKVDHEKELVVCKAEPTPSEYLWSPDSKRFLIETSHLTQGTITASIIEAKTLKVLGDGVTTTAASKPVWSPDSKYLALSTEDDSTQTIKLDIYALASKTSATIVTATGARGPYIVEYWNEETIGYTEMTASGERAEQTVKVGS